MTREAPAASRRREPPPSHASIEVGGAMTASTKYLTKRCCIWLPGTQWSGTTWATYKPSFMKTTALVAMEATKDLWAAFIRTMGTPVGQRRAKAEAEAQTLVKNWLSFNSGEMLRWYDDDSHRDADTGVRVRMKSQSTQQYMTAPLANNAPVKTVVGTPLDLIIVGPASGTLFRATFDPGLFLSYSGTADGTVKLWNGTQESSFSIVGPAGPGRKAVMNLYWQQYIWVDGSGNVYLTRQGNPVNDNARWTVEGLP